MRAFLRHNPTKFSHAKNKAREPSRALPCAGLGGNPWKPNYDFSVFSVFSESAAGASVAFAEPFKTPSATAALVSAALSESLPGLSGEMNA